jgi:cysteine desulfurase/selenocysteine lyase
MYYHSYHIDREILQAREAIGHLINAEHPREEIVFFLNGTQALNTVLKGFPWKPKDKILTTEMEHNSLEVPIRQLAKELQLQILRIPFRAGFIDPVDIEQILTEHPQIRLIALAEMDNIFGRIRPIEQICRLAHSIGTKVLVDGAQTLMHMRVDVQRTGADFQTFSMHKAFGLPGVGVLYIKQPYGTRLIRPLISGGGTVASEQSPEQFLEMPNRFEAGIRNVPAILASAKAVPILMDYRETGMLEYLEELTRYAFERLAGIPGIYFLDENTTRVYHGFIVFGIHGLPSRDLGVMLDELARCCVRVGAQCQTVYFTKLRASELQLRQSTNSEEPEQERFLVRISLAPYNTKQEVDVLYQTLQDLLA